jgi:hypothetical protein
VTKVTRVGVERNLRQQSNRSERVSMAIAAADYFIVTKATSIKKSWLGSERERGTGVQGVECVIESNEVTRV